MIDTEIQFLKELDHPFLIKIIDFGKGADFERENFTTQKVNFVVFELCSNGELMDVVLLS